jgi:alpha/beta superfamily hydrolase
MTAGDAAPARAAAKWAASRHSRAKQTRCSRFETNSVMALSAASSQARTWDARRNFRAAKVVPQ